MTRPLRICSHPGCPEFTDRGACPTHAPPRAPDHRPDSTARGYDRRWAGYSKRYRDKHPLCEACLERGRRAHAELVDHIAPVTGPSDPGFWNSKNHQSLCRPCHAAKTAKEGRTAQPTPRRGFVR